jgi:hypothetical protein
VARLKKLPNRPKHANESLANWPNTDSKIVHIFTMFLTIAAVLTKTAFEPRRFLDPRLEAPPLEVKIPTA